LITWDLKGKGSSGSSNVDVCGYQNLVKHGSRDKAVPALWAITGRLSGE
jgi:hypothetical protein